MGILIVISGLVLILSVLLGLVSQFKCLKVSRWMKKNMLNEWAQLSWFSQKAACGSIGISKVMRKRNIENSEFTALYQSWKFVDRVAWILLLTSCVGFLVLGVLSAQS